MHLAFGNADADADAGDVHDHRRGGPLQRRRCPHPGRPVTGDGRRHFHVHNEHRCA
jgi:hypothetical protein